MTSSVCACIAAVFDLMAESAFNMVILIKK